MISLLQCLNLSSHFENHIISKSKLGVITTVNIVRQITVNRVGQITVNIVGQITVNRVGQITVNIVGQITVNRVSLLSEY